MKKCFLIFLLFFPIITMSQTITGIIHGETTGDESGTSIALDDDGSHVVIGAPGNDGNGDDTGHVRVYVRDNSNNSWLQLGSDIDGTPITYANSYRGGSSGWSVDIDNDGSHIIVGAADLAISGKARVFTWVGFEWVQMGSDIIPPKSNGWGSWGAGYRVSIDDDGSHIALTTRRIDNDCTMIDNSGCYGQVEIYTMSNGDWSRVGGGIGNPTSGNYEEFGGSISLDGDGSHIAIADPMRGNNNAGRVQVYTWNDSNWVKLGSNIDGNNNSRTGYSIDLDYDGSHLVVGSPKNSGNGDNSGRARIYMWNDDSADWDQVGSDILGDSGDESGTSVAIDDDGSHVVIGAPLNGDNGNNSGRARIYSFNGEDWSQLGKDINGLAASDGFGASVALDSEGNYFAVGSPNNNEGYVVVGETFDFDSPFITATTISSDNSVIEVSFNEIVYGGTGEGELDVSDFTLISGGGEATLSSSTPTSISTSLVESFSVVSLGIDLLGTPNGSEIIAVLPSSEAAIFDFANNAASMNQSNNTVVLNNVPPTFDAVRLSLDNASVSITASETLYTTTGGSGDLVEADFTLSISGGTATLSSTTPTSISTNGLITTLGIGLSGTPDGDEILRVNPASSTSIYDGGDEALSATSIMSSSGAGINLFPNTLTASSLTVSGTTTSSSLVVGSVIINEDNIGHSSDTNLMTLSNGTLIVDGDVVVSSDVRLKSNIVDLGPTLLSLLKLEAKKYTLKNDEQQRKKIGLLAQEVQKVFPELTVEDKNGMLSVNYQALVPVLINALKEQEENYKELENSIEILEKEFMKNK